MKLAEQEARDMVGEGREPENPVVETESSATVTRLTYKNGYSGWTSSALHLSEHDQDALEEAYELGVQAARRNAQTMFEAGYGKGARDAAVTAYGGRRQ
jgi:hypothetical protein